MISLIVLVTSGNRVPVETRLSTLQQQTPKSVLLRSKKLH